MTEVIGVVFNQAGKIYYFTTDDEEIKEGDQVIVETARGIEIGKVVIDAKQIDESEFDSELKAIKRKATMSDLEQARQNEEEAEKAFDICLKKIDKHGLPMKLIDSEYTFDKGKLLFYFTADGRVDFRELVKDLASVFRTRIELRQIGVRDETKMMGGIGPCGRKLCCNNFLRDFESISIRMAKEQDLSLNPEKISGICGRLMCCLDYEIDYYQEMKKKFPNIGDKVRTNVGIGKIEDLNIIKKTLKIRLGDNEKIEVPIDDVETDLDE